MRTKRWTLQALGACVLVVGALGASAQDAAGSVSQLVQDFRKAEQDYNVPALARLISDRFVEISPAGEIDEHDHFLGFYTPDKKIEWPPYTVDEAPIRIFGDTAIDIVTFHYSMPGPGWPEASHGHSLDLYGAEDWRNVEADSDTAHRRTACTARCKVAV